MIIGIDFGITNTDIVAYEENNYEFFSVKSEKLNTNFLEKIFDFINIDINEVEKIAITGGKSSDLCDLYNNIPVIKVNEVKAIGCGAKNLYEIEEASYVAISAGTGTACVACNDNVFSHLGGISVGGGTLLGLSNLITNINSADKLDKMALEGNRKNLDALIGEVVNDIGSLYPDITASNFVKSVDNTSHSNEDVLASISNMIGEVIGTISYLNALLMNVDRVYFVGRVTLLESVKKGIDKRLSLANISGIYKENREFGNALGAIAYAKENN